MPLLLAPILAQLVTLNLGARTEARYVAPLAPHYQEETRPLAALNLAWQHTSATLLYTPSLLLIKPDSAPLDLVVFHSLSLTATTQMRHVKVFVMQTGGYGEVAPAAQVLGGAPLNQPTTGTGGTGTGGTGTGGTGTGGTGGGLATQPLALSQIYLLETAGTTAGVAYEVTALDTLSIDGGYSLQRGADATSLVLFPLFQTARARFGWRRRVAPPDTVTTLLVSQYGWAKDGSNAWVNALTESWAHQFSLLTTGTVGAGVSLARTTAPDGSVSTSVLPVATTAITHTEPLARGALTLNAGASFAPTIVAGARVGQNQDARTTVDPSMSFLAGVGWAREKFSVGLTGTATVSLAGAEQAGAQDAVGGAFRMAYQLARFVGIDAGVRGAWQVFQGQTTIPPTYAAFAGISVADQFRLNGR